jgi:hypothetical protein
LRLGLMISPDITRTLPDLSVTVTGKTLRELLPVASA